MCDPVTLGISAALGIGSKLVGNSESMNAASREAAARNAVLKATIAKEQGYADQNAGELNNNVAHYAPGSQEAQLADAQAKRTTNSTGNMTTDNPSAAPLPADSNPAAAGDLAKRLLAAHDGAVERAGLKAKVGGYGDTWLTNNLNTNAADRNIGVTNNYAEGAKSILPALQDSAAAAVYKPPSIWSTILSGASSIAAAKAGATGAKAVGTAVPSAGTGVFDPTAIGSLY